MIDVGLRQLHARLFIDGKELGAGYGKSTPQAIRAQAELAHGPRLDGVYSAKAAAALLRLHRAGIGPLLFWASKSTAVLAVPDSLRGAPRVLFDWLTSDPSELARARSH